MPYMYLSSTVGDLDLYCKIIAQALQCMQDLHIMMVDAQTADAQPFLDAVASCDLYCSLIGRYDDALPAQGKPERQIRVELEYQQAVGLGKTCLFFLQDEEVPDPFTSSTQDTTQPRSDKYIQELRQHLAQTHSVSFFHSPAQLVALVMLAFLQWEQQRSAAHSLEHELERLPDWWRATLLRNSVSKRVDTYPLEAFTVLIQQQRTQDALALAETLTDPTLKVNVLIQVAQQWSRQAQTQPAYAERSEQLLTKAYVLARNLTDIKTRHKSLIDVCAVFAALQHWERAEAITSIIKDNATAALAWGRICAELVQAKQPARAQKTWEQAKVEIGNIEQEQAQAETLFKLGLDLKSTYKEQWVLQAWQEAGQIIAILEDTIQRSNMLQVLDKERCIFALEFARHIFSEQKQQRKNTEHFKKIERIVRSIQNTIIKCKAFIELGGELAQQGQLLHATQAWQQAEEIIPTIEELPLRASLLSELATTSSKAGRLKRGDELWQEARSAALACQNERDRALALWNIGVALASVGKWQEAEALWQEVATTGNQSAEQGFIPGWDNAAALHRLVTILLQEQRREQARNVVLRIKNPDIRDLALRDLALSYQEGQDWQQTQEVAHQIESLRLRAETVQTIGIALARQQKGEQAKALWLESIATTRMLSDSIISAYALRTLGSALAAAGQQQEARKVWEHATLQAQLIEEPLIKAEALRDLGVALANSPNAGLDDMHLLSQAHKLWDAAETAAGQVKPDWVQANLLRSLASALTQAKQWERAEAVAQHIDSVWAGHAEALRELVFALVQAQQWKQAVDVAYTIKERRIQADVLKELGHAFIRVQQWDLVTKVIPLITERETRAKVLCLLGTALAQVQRWQQAQKAWDEVKQIAQTISSNYTKTTLLNELGAALAQAGEQAQALACWSEAEHVAHTIESGWLRTQALGQLGVRFAQMQQLEHAHVLWREAEQAARQLHFDRDQAEALCALATFHAQAQQQEQADRLWAEAEQLAHAIHEEQVKVGVLRTIVSSLLHIERWEQAQKIALQIKGVWASRDETLHDLATYLIKVQQWVQAETVIGAMKEDRIKSVTLCDLGRALSQAQQHERAETIWNVAERITRRVEPLSIRVEALRRLGVALDQSQHKERAREVWRQSETTAYQLEDSAERAQLLQRLAATLAAAGAYDQFIHLIQRAWSQAQTRQATIQLLPLVNNIIAVKPELGTAFFDAFAWVDQIIQQN